jgi:hypothetical protein
MLVFFAVLLAVGTFGFWVGARFASVQEKR